MATVDKNFRIKNGLVVEGSSATVNGENILREGSSDSYIINLIGGTATSDNTAGTVVKRDANGNFAAGTITADLVGNVTGTVSSLSNHDTGDLAEGVSNLYFTEQRALDATAAAYDTAGSAATAQANAESYALNAIENAAGSYIDWDPTVNQLNVNTNDIAQVFGQTFDSYGSASNAQSAAEDYADNAISTALYPGGAFAFDTYGAASTAEANANTYTDSAISNGLAVNGNIFNAIQTAKGEATAYTDTAVANLVDGAPALLDTLNELAAAIADNPNYATDVANLVSTKADTSYVDSEISDLDTAAQGYASSAQSAAESYADGLAVNYDAAGAAAQAEANANDYTDGVASDILDGTSTFAEVNINNVSKEFAATTGNIATAAQTTAYQFNKSAFRSAKFLVKIKNGTHTEVSEVLLTLDTADNVYLTEYGMSSTSGTSLGTITADTDATHVRIRVTPANNNSEVMVAGTLLI